MAHTYNYSVLLASPDKRRGERVNIGLVVFRPDCLDIRISEISKLRAICGGEWTGFAEEVKRRMVANFAVGDGPQILIERLASFENIVSLSGLGWFVVDRPEQYEEHVQQIEDSLINRPRAESKPKTTRINTEIARQFKKVRLLARADEGVDSHKVHRDYIVSGHEQLRADFVAKNGIYHVTATLDLRRAAVDISQAALKAVVLHKSTAAFGDNVQRIGVYAAPDECAFKSHIELLGDYSNSVYNWEVSDQRIAYLRRMYDALTPIVSGMT
jgi:hypothetical protein